MEDHDYLYLDRLAHDAKDAVVRFWSSLHAATYRVTEGRVLNRVLGMRVIQLTTTGRRTGGSRPTMLTAPIVEQERIVLVASNGGDDRDPQWYRNVLACPEVSVMLEGTTSAMRARVAAASERSDLWRRIRTVTPTYDLYQSRTTRELPVVVLEPTVGGAKAGSPGV
jgi:deazaflavin-dependent oxidoreductase (nitroreductase family)